MNNSNPCSKKRLCKLQENLLLSRHGVKNTKGKTGQLKILISINLLCPIE